VAESKGRVALVVAVGEALKGKFKAGSLISASAVHIAGSGGGRDDFAQAGGTDANGMQLAIQKIRELIS
jgi:alanyl-tRNA synthetase